MPKDGIPWTRKRGGVYYAYWYDKQRERTRRISLGTRDPTEAQARFASFLTSGSAIRGEDPQELTCDVALDDYMTEYAKPKLADANRQKIAVAHLKVHFAGVPVRDISHAIVARYCERRSAGEIGQRSQGSTHRRELCVLQAAITRKVRQRVIKPGDAPYIELPPAAEPKDRWLTKDELARLIEATEGRLRLFINIAYYTASRRQAIETLTWFQVDLERGRIQLAKTGERRTKKRRPAVPISPALRPWLEQAHRLRQSEYVLDTPHPVYAEFKSVVRKLGMDDVTPHTLRHTRAVHLAQDGVSLYAIAGLLGDTVATVERSYLHHCPDHLQAVLAVDEKELTV